MTGWLVLVGAAQDPEDPGTQPDEAELELIVYGELQVEAARRAVVDELAELGFTDVVERGDHVVYRHERPWHGEVVLYEDGWMEVKRQPLRVEGREVPWARQDTPLAWAGCLIYPWACLRINGAMVGSRRWRSSESRTVAAVQPKVQAWGDRIADLAVEHRSDALPQRLEALWTEGIGLQGGARLQTYRERRAALLSYWASRTDTVWGDEIRRAVIAFCRAVVQHSDHPFTDAELRAFGATQEILSSSPRSPGPAEVGAP
ncbi:MAG TPA: hypothetical protein ENK18_03645 [Deltaproteobacteria bacterium]|nr:hypothetical protein [Deltaproteobacteria bacterium]